MSVTSPKSSTPWLLLTFSLPAKRASQRVKVWRKLQRFGAVPLGNSGYLLPNNPTNQERFEWLATAIRKYAGEASVVKAQSIDNLSTPQLIGRFAEARSSEYHELIRELQKLSTVPAQKWASGRVNRLRARFREVVEIDFFNSPLQKRVEEVLVRADTSPTAARESAKINLREYAGRVWVTRPRPGIDRSASISMAFRTLTYDGWLLFATRSTRLFAYGSLSVILVFYLIGLGLTEAQTGLVLTLTLVGDVVVSLYLTTRADRLGRRRMLIVGSLLVAAAGMAFASTSNLFFLILAGTIGVISPSGHEVGPFLSIEQAALSHIVPASSRTEVFAWYTLAGSVATASGALFGGLVTQALQKSAMSIVASYRVVVLVYAAIGIILAILFTRLSAFIEVNPRVDAAATQFFGIARSRITVLKLSSLFALDSFGGGSSCRVSQHIGFISVSV